ncbi:hypothetical protein SPRG_21410, partial [Saprolegnia parasitica CBS 223.65]
SPTHPINNFLQYTRVTLNTGPQLPPTSMPDGHAQYLLARDVFQYNFDRERTLVGSGGRGRRNSTDSGSVASEGDRNVRV